LIKIIDNFIASSLINKDITEPWSYAEFRGSSLPLCQRQLLLGQFQQAKMVKSLSFEDRYSFHVGRAIKTLTHEFWVNQMWGDWRCTNTQECGIRFNNTFLKDGKCRRCGSSTTYIEKVLKDKETGFSGQCDAIVFCDELKGYLVFEFNSKNRNIITTTEEPYLSEKLQVSAYATLLSRQYYLRIIGRVVLWIGKPKPNPYKFWFYPGLGEGLIEQQFQLKRDLDQKLKEGRIQEIQGCCTTHQDAESKNCPFAGICLSPVRDRLIEEEYKGWLSGKTH